MKSKIFAGHCQCLYKEAVLKLQDGSYSIIEVIEQPSVR
jgi:hypothetical protein